MVFGVDNLSMMSMPVMWMRSSMGYLVLLSMRRLISPLGKTVHCAPSKQFQTTFTISGWKNSWPRDLWVDFSSSFADNKNILITNALKPPMDFTSLMRTFQVESWIYIILTVTAIVLIIAVQSYLVEGEKIQLFQLIVNSLIFLIS